MYIFDDVVDKETQDKIEKSIFSKETKWIFARTVFYDGTNPEVNDTQRNSLMSFTNLMMDPVNQPLSDPNIELYKKPIQTVVGLNEILQIRAQLQLPVLTEKNKLYGVPHVDGYRDKPYMVGVYYVNDSDGPTYIFKQTTNNTTPLNVINGKLDVETTVEPKKGRLLIFNGNIYHAVGKPKRDVRAVLNYHFTL
jgi:hypothetical protein